MSNYYKIKKSDISNGDGDRVSIFFSGCDIHCPGCFNQELWDPNAGEEYTEDTFKTICSYMTKHKRGLSILGGEPFSKYNRDTVAELCLKFKEKFPDKTIYVWSGYTESYLRGKNNSSIDIILGTADKLIDGPFVEEQRNLNLVMRGSSNQRVINLH